MWMCCKGGHYRGFFVYAHIIGQHKHLSLASKEEEPSTWGAGSGSGLFRHKLSPGTNPLSSILNSILNSSQPLNHANITHWWPERNIQTLLRASGALCFLTYFPIQIWVPSQAEHKEWWKMRWFSRLLWAIIFVRQPSGCGVPKCGSDTH